MVHLIIKLFFLKDIKYIDVLCGASKLTCPAGQLSSSSQLIVFILTNNFYFTINFISVMTFIMQQRNTNPYIFK